MPPVPVQKKREKKKRGGKKSGLDPFHIEEEPKSPAMRRICKRRKKDDSPSTPWCKGGRIGDIVERKRSDPHRIAHGEGKRNER